MIVKLLKSKLNRDGYLDPPMKESAFTPFFRVENSFMNMILLADAREGKGFTLEEFNSIKKDLYEKQSTGNHEVHLMTLFLFDNELPEIDEYMSWGINCQTDELIVNDNNVEDFYGLRAYLEEFLLSAKALIASGDMKAIERSLRTSEEEEKYEKSIKRKPTPAIILVVTINVIIFLTQYVVGDAFTESGYMDSSLIRNGDYFRVITAMFLHANITHLFSNMVLLYFLGEMIEHLIGTAKTGIIYLLSGVLGNVVSYCYHVYVIGEDYTALGASGAVYGLIGVVVFLTIIKWEGLNIPLKRMVIMVAYCLYSSIVGSQIDVGAHIGGLIAGFILAAILCHKGGKTSES